jgi:nucleotidyltransferase/DNA polymerase involved in DNA repair
VIVCLRLPYFSAEVVRRAAGISPETPLVVTRSSRVVASSARAAQQHITPGITQRQAKAILPDAVYLPEDEARRRAAVSGVLDALATFTPMVEYQDNVQRGKRKQPPQPQDEAQSALFYADLETLNMTEAQKLAPDMGNAVQRVTGITVSLGSASRKYPAFVAAASAEPGQPAWIMPGEEATYLADMPIELLPLDNEQRRRLHLLGLTSMGQLAALPLQAMLTQFGKSGFLLHRLVQGLDHERVLPHRFEAVEHMLCEFDEPLTSRTTLEAVLESMAIELVSRLQAKASMGRSLTLTLYLENKTLQESQITLRRAVAGIAAMTRTLRQLLERLKIQHSGVVGIEVKVGQLLPLAGQQLDLFIHRSDQRERLQETLATLRIRYDDECFLWITPAEVASRQIEQRYRLQSAGKP